MNAVAGVDPAAAAAEVTMAVAVVVTLMVSATVMVTAAVVVAAAVMTVVGVAVVGVVNVARVIRWGLSDAPAYQVTATAQSFPLSKAITPRTTFVGALK